MTTTLKVSRVEGSPYLFILLVLNFLLSFCLRALYPTFLQHFCVLVCLLLAIFIDVLHLDRKFHDIQLCRTQKVISYITYSEKVWRALNWLSVVIGGFKFGDLIRYRRRRVCNNLYWRVLNLAIFTEFAKSPN